MEVSILTPKSVHVTDLYAQVDRHRLPRHVAIIMDGNGRWARQRGLMRIDGHRAGIEAVRQSVRTCRNLRIPALTLYALSAENYQLRPKSEILALMQLLIHFMRSETKEMQDNRIRFDSVGHLAELPERVVRQIEKTRADTAAGDDMVLTLALNYGARTEITDAVCRIVQAAQRGDVALEDITEEYVAQQLYLGDLPDPDLLIRTSGEVRISNFLLWHIAYAELVFTNVLWPDFKEEHLLRAILDYQKRERRFGGVAESVAPAVSSVS